MAEVWVAYDHVIHYKVDIENREILEVEIPGWMNTYDQPGAIWSDDGQISLTDTEEDAMIEVLETESYPTPYFG